MLTIESKVWKELFPAYEKNAVSDRDENTQYATRNAAETLLSRNNLK
jgi:hypothetical protein